MLAVVVVTTVEVPVNVTRPGATGTGTLDRPRLRVTFWGPAAVGAKVTTMGQLAAAARVVPQDCAATTVKSALDPMMVGFRFSGLVPVLVISTTVLVSGLPTKFLPKS